MDPDRVDGPAECRQAAHRILLPAELLRDHDAGIAAAREIGGIDAKFARVRRRVGVVQSQIPGDQIDMAIVVEITRGQAVPPAA